MEEEQKAVAVRVLAAVAIVVVAIVAIGLLTYGRPAERDAERLRSLAIAVASVTVWLPVTMAKVMHLRFFSAEDIEGATSGKESKGVKTASAILENTLEQAVLAFAIYSLAAYAVPHPQPLLAFSALLFTIGRILFWYGYSDGASGRALGFALTFFSTIGTMIVGLVFIAIRLLA